MKLPEQIRSQIADRMVRIVTPTAIIGMIAATGGFVLAGQSEYFRLFPAMTAMVAMFPAYLLNKKGHPFKAAIFIISGIGLALLVGMVLNGGLRAPSFIASIPLATIVVIVFGLKGGLTFTAIAAASGIVFILLESNKILLPQEPPPLLLYLILLIIFIFMQISFVLIPVYLMKKALKESEKQKEKIKRAQEEKISAITLSAENRKMALVGQIAGKMAHDFNNVLGAIMGNTELALMECSDAETRKSLDIIFNQTVRGRNLTRNLVAFAKDNEPRQEFFSVDKKLSLVIELMQKDLDGIKVLRERSENLPDLLADPGMIEHAFVNIIQNAIHATSLEKDPQIIIRTSLADQMIVIEFEDNGCGIPESSMENVFDPSFTLKGSRDKNGSYLQTIKGTGYGLANVKRYVEQHKGRVDLHSTEDKGTKIIVRLPVTEPALTKNEVEVIKQQSEITGKRILLVEDEPSISSVQHTILSSDPCRHSVDLAQTGSQAVEYLDQTAYDMVSLDYILPGGINGMDVYHHIRTLYPDLPVLFISGNIEFLESVKDLKQQDLYVDHLSKPSKNIDYLQAVNTMLELSEQPSA